jgi:hypothetical protein
MDLASGNERGENVTVPLLGLVLLMWHQGELAPKIFG